MILERAHGTMNDPLRLPVDIDVALRNMGTISIMVELEKVVPGTAARCADAEALPPGEIIVISVFVLGDY